MPRLRIDIIQDGDLWEADEYMDADIELLFAIREAVDAHLLANMPDDVGWQMNLDDVFHDVEVDKSVSIPALTFKNGEETYIIEFEMEENYNNNNNNNNNNSNLTGGKRKSRRSIRHRRNTRRRNTRRRKTRMRSNRRK